MKTIYKSLQIRTPKHALMMTICILFMGNSLLASGIPKNDGEGPAFNATEMEDFDSNAVYGDLVLEDWMTSPFENSLP